MAVGLGAHVVIVREVVRGDGPVADHDAVGHAHVGVAFVDVDAVDEAAHEAGFAGAAGADEEEAGAVVGGGLSSELAEIGEDIFGSDFVGDVVQLGWREEIAKVEVED